MRMPNSATEKSIRPLTLSYVLLAVTKQFSTHAIGKDVPQDLK